MSILGAIAVGVVVGVLVSIAAIIVDKWLRAKVGE